MSPRKRVSRIVEEARCSNWHERNACDDLRPTASAGSRVTIGEGAPVIRPVNFVFDEPSRSVVFRTALGSKFHVLLRSADAAFEIDGIDQGSRTGWSVIMRGVTDEVTNPSELRRLDSLGLEPWAPGHKHAGCTSVRGQSRAGG